MRQPTECTTGNGAAPTAFLRCLLTNRCLSLVSLLGSVVGSTLGASLVGAALESTYADTLGSSFDDLVPSSICCVCGSLKLA